MIDALKSIEPIGFLSFAPASAGTNRADVYRRIIQNRPYGRGGSASAACRPVWFRLRRLRFEVSSPPISFDGAGSTLIRPSAQRYACDRIFLFRELLLHLPLNGGVTAPCLRKKPLEMLIELEPKLLYSLNRAERIYHFEKLGG